MLRVLTLNIWNLSGGWSARREEILRWLDRLDADVVCLQEIVDDGTRNTARWLAERAGFEGVAFGGVEVVPGLLFGPAVLTRSPLERSASFELPNEPAPNDIPRVLVHARAGGRDVFTTHLTSLYESGALRERQVLRITELVREHAAPDAPLPPILAGDFNAEPDSAEIRFLCGLQSIDGRSAYFQDAWRVAGSRGPGSTWDNRNPFAAAEFEPDRRIDYVFVGWRRDSGAGRVESARVVCDRVLAGNVYASDHFGLLAEIAT
ncbi:MAG TPA: endonuclease/exonuclease/phosphatase family protein [Acidimicrobiales bacterium]|nr:endonuclease/exonuclease/phosphatase family protein [Acidimicrobiales bacterium]